MPKNAIGFRPQVYAAIRKHAELWRVPIIDAAQAIFESALSDEEIMDQASTIASHLCEHRASERERLLQNEIRSLQRKLEEMRTV